VKNSLIKLTITALVAAAAYFGLYEGHEQALNMLKFYVWITTPIMFLALLGVGMMSTAERTKARENITWAPIRFIGNGVSFGVAFALASYGHVATAAAMFLATVCGLAAISVLKKG
jgi:hypothetical protein